MSRATTAGSRVQPNHVKVTRDKVGVILSNVLTIRDNDRITEDNVGAMLDHVEKMWVNVKSH